LDKVNIGVIGFGYWGPNLVRNFASLPNARVRYIADLSESRRRHAEGLYAGAVEVTPDYRRLLDAPDVAAVCIATPVRTHFGLGKEALEAGKHVFVEKPLTASVAEAEELVALAEAKGRVFMVGHVFEYNPAVNKLKELIHGGELGRVLYVAAARLNLGPFREDVNVLWDLASHDVSILNYLLWRAPKAVCATGTCQLTPAIEDVAFVSLFYPDNVIAHCHVSWLDPCKIRRVTIVGDKKMAVYDDLSTAEPVKIYDRRFARQPYLDTFGEFRLFCASGDIFSPKVDAAEPLKIECADFVGAVQSGRKPRSDGASGLRVVRVLEAAEKSLRHQGARVVIEPPAGSQPAGG